jgi:hypothetical protein
LAGELRIYLHDVQASCWIEEAQFLERLVASATEEVGSLLLYFEMRGRVFLVLDVSSKHREQESNGDRRDFGMPGKAFQSTGRKAATATSRVILYRSSVFIETFRIRSAVKIS